MPSFLVGVADSPKHHAHFSLAIARLYTGAATWWHSSTMHNPLSAKAEA